MHVIHAVAEATGAHRTPRELGESGDGESGSIGDKLHDVRVLSLKAGLPHATLRVWESAYAHLLCGWYQRAAHRTAEDVVADSSDARMHRSQVWRAVLV